MILPWLQNPSPGLLETAEEITRLYKSLPRRASIEEFEAALSVIKTVDSEEQAKFQEISKQECPEDVPKELFSVLQQFRRNMVLFQCYEQRKEAIYLVEVDKMFEIFDGLIQKASLLVSGDTQNDTRIDAIDFTDKIGEKSMIDGETLVKEMEEGDLPKDGFHNLERSSPPQAAFSSGECHAEKWNLMKVAASIENVAKIGAACLDLKGKLMDQIEWLPLSIEKLTAVIQMDLSENKLMALPSSTSSLNALTKLDVHANQLINLPISFGELTNLADLNLRANRLKTLPTSFGNLTHLKNLDLSSNQFTHWPQTIGKLTSLETLNMECNELTEVMTGNCISLVELRLDFNQLKTLPESIGKLEMLEILTARYNRIRALPMTMGNLSSLRELDVSYNELQFIPESLCSALHLKKLNVAKNFADLRTLPDAIGNLEMLEELDISDNQIRFLPYSFRLLSRLSVLCADETPLEVPPREIITLGAQVVVQFMNDLYWVLNFNHQRK